jgi:predicted metal-dependent RNase
MATAINLYDNKPYEVIKHKNIYYRKVNEYTYEIFKIVYDQIDTNDIGNKIWHFYIDNKLYNVYYCNDLHFNRLIEGKEVTTQLSIFDNLEDDDEKDN